MVLLSLLTTVFGVNLLCAFVPCEQKWEPSDAFIGPSYYENSSISRRNVLLNEHPIVYIKSGGGLQGYSMGTMNGHRIHAFEGIQYGMPPVGQLRFRVREYYMLNPT